jgi:hypothetical protein
MLVSDVINDAKYGELQQLAVKEDYEAILSYINMGMLELYKRFSLRTEEAIVYLDAHTTMYQLIPTNPKVEMLSNCDLMYIQGVYEEDGSRCGMNDEEDVDSILTPSYDTIQVPNPSDYTYLSVVYVATPTRLTTPTDTIRLPMSLYEALLHYIGYRGHGSIDGNINTENNTHYMRFDKSCTVAKEYGLVTADEIPYRKVNTKGFI